MFASSFFAPSVVPTSEAGQKFVTTRPVLSSRYFFALMPPTPLDVKKNVGHGSSPVRPRS